MNKGSFEDYKLSDEITTALKSLGYETPTEVQKKVISLALEQNDIVVKSQTGSGKTASYGIPICESVDWLENKPQALILTPTRELAVQVKDDITNIGRWKRIKAIALYGKQPIAIQKTELKQKTHVVVGTPGRVKDHLERGSLDVSHLRYLIIDEADEMLNMGFIDQVKDIIKELPRNRVTMLFSATLPEAVKNLAQRFMRNPIDIEVESTGMTAEEIEHSLYRVTEFDKFALLTDVTTVQNPDSCLVFCRTKERVDTLCERLHDLGYRCDKIHGGMEQVDRLKAMNRFKRGEILYLIATDVAARGIDVENITLIINYDIPLEREAYVHRTGRTGRAGQTGIAITFVTKYEERYLAEIEEFIGFKILNKVSPTAEEVTAHKSIFLQKMKAEPIIKKSKSEQLDKQITKLRFNAGKKKKLRATNFVWVICSIEGITAEDVGIITVMDTLSYVEILNGKGPKVLAALESDVWKGKLPKVKIYKDR